MLPYGRHQISASDIDAVVTVLRSAWLTTGPTVSAFEHAFAAETGARSAVALSSGTAALHASAYAAGLGPGDEAIVPVLTFAATANAVRYQGAAVVFADVRRDTLCLDAAEVERLITRRTKAVLTVDYAGSPSDLEQLRELSRDGITLIEDAAHSLGASYRGTKVGAIADMTVFSLHPVKHITAGEGGMLTTNDAELAYRARLLRNHGITTDHRERTEAGTHAYEMIDLGFNYRLTDIQSALGLSQLARLQSLLARRTEIAARYDAAFKPFDALELMTVPPDRDPAWHIYVIRLELEQLRIDRDRFVNALRAENIGANVHFMPVPWHPYYRRLGYERGGWPVAEAEYRRLVTLPIFPAMTDSDVDDVIEAVERLVGYYRR